MAATNYFDIYNKEQTDYIRFHFLDQRINSYDIYVCDLEGKFNTLIYDVNENDKVESIIIENYDPITIGKIGLGDNNIIYDNTSLYDHPLLSIIKVYNNILALYFIRQSNMNININILTTDEFIRCINGNAFVFYNEKYFILTHQTVYNIPGNKTESIININAFPEYDNPAFSFDIFDQYGNKAVSLNNYYVINDNIYITVDKISNRQYKITTIRDKIFTKNDTDEGHFYTYDNFIIRFNLLLCSIKHSVSEIPTSNDYVQISENKFINVIHTDYKVENKYVKCIFIVGEQYVQVENIYNVVTLIDENNGLEYSFINNTDEYDNFIKEYQNFKVYKDKKNKFIEQYGYYYDGVFNNIVLYTPSNDLQIYDDEFIIDNTLYINYKIYNGKNIKIDYKLIPNYSFNITINVNKDNLPDILFSDSGNIIVNDPIGKFYNEKYSGSLIFSINNDMTYKQILSKINILLYKENIYPTEIILDTYELFINTNKTYRFKPRILPANSTFTDIRYQLSATSGIVNISDYAVIDNSGFLSIIKYYDKPLILAINIVKTQIGNNITLIKNVKNNTCTINIIKDEVKLNSLTIVNLSNKTTIQSGDEISFKCIIDPSDTDYNQVSWTAELAENIYITNISGLIKVNEDNSITFTGYNTYDYDINYTIKCVSKANINIYDTIIITVRGIEIKCNKLEIYNTANTLYPSGHNLNIGVYTQMLLYYNVEPYNASNKHIDEILLNGTDKYITYTSTIYNDKQGVIITPIYKSVITSTDVSISFNTSDGSNISSTLNIYIQKIQSLNIYLSKIENDTIINLDIPNELNINNLEKYKFETEILVYGNKPINKINNKIKWKLKIDSEYLKYISLQTENNNLYLTSYLSELEEDINCELLCECEADINVNKTIKIIFKKCVDNPNIPSDEITYIGTTEVIGENVIINIDESALQSETEYTLKYINSNDEIISSFDNIITFNI